MSLLEAFKAPWAGKFKKIGSSRRLIVIEPVLLDVRIRRARNKSSIDTFNKLLLKSSQINLLESLWNEIVTYLKLFN